MNQPDYSKLGVLPEEVGFLLLALRKLTCAQCGIAFPDHGPGRKSHTDDHLFEAPEGVEDEL